jgi:hypothetical protein
MTPTAGMTALISRKIRDGKISIANE